MTCPRCNSSKTRPEGRDRMIQMALIFAALALTIGWVWWPLMLGGLCGAAAYLLMIPTARGRILCQNCGYWGPPAERSDGADWG